MLARRAYAAVQYRGVDITPEVQKNIIGFRYTDNASKNADDIELILEDKSGKWMNEWHPMKGDEIKASINTINWRKEIDVQFLPCGTFIIDEPEYSGRPKVISIKGIAVPASSNFTETKKSRAWENITLKAIAGDIAASAGLKLFFDSKDNPFFNRVEQSETADMSFLADICEKQGLAFKVTSATIVIFNEEEYEKRDSVAIYEESSSNVKSYDFQSSLRATAYAACRVKYFDPEKGRKIEYIFSLKEDLDPKKDKIYELNARVKSAVEAKRLAQKTLRKFNKEEVTAFITVVGNTDLVGGNCILLKEFGVYSGKYYIQKAAHSLVPYSVDLELRKVLEGY